MQRARLSLNSLTSQLHIEEEFRSPFLSSIYAHELTHTAYKPAQMVGLLKAFVLSIFPLAVLVTSIDYPDGIVLPPTYQSNHLTFNDWVLLFTLCLAPLIAHIVAGVPPIVYLSQDRPTWRQKLGLYNPTTIIWRYFSITDRRLRAKHWSAAALSASNVYFWTRVGWDGSDALVRKSQAYCVSFPQSKHATLISWSTVKTIIVTLQGADALYLSPRKLLLHRAVDKWQQRLQQYDFSWVTIHAPSYHRVAETRCLLLVDGGLCLCQLRRSSNYANKIK